MLTPPDGRTDGSVIGSRWPCLAMSSLSLCHSWGFAYKASFVRDKVKHNYRHYNSVRHEVLLVATRGSCVPQVTKLFDSVQAIERSSKHSEKPEKFRQIIETLYPHGAKLDTHRPTCVVVVNVRFRHESSPCNASTTLRAVRQ
jgi:N6-adenosine-specific RNA methylase IME4